MRSLDRPFRRFSSVTVIENCLAMLKSVSPWRTRYVFGAEDEVARVELVGRAAAADGSDVAERAGIINSCLAVSFALADKPLASRSSFAEMPYFLETDMTESPRLTVWNLKERYNE